MLCAGPLFNFFFLFLFLSSLLSLPPFVLAYPSRDAPRPFNLLNLPATLGFVVCVLSSPILSSFGCVFFLFYMCRAGGSALRVPFPLSFAPAAALAAAAARPKL